MHKTSLIIILLLCSLLGPGRSGAMAGDITLAITTSATVVQETAADAPTARAEIKVTINNKGNEPANKVSIQAQLFADQQTVKIAEQIPPALSAEGSFSMPIPAGLNGSYPLFLNILYEHANGQPVATASLAVLRTTGAESQPPFALKLEQKRDNNSLTVLVSTPPLQGLDSLPTDGELTLTCYVPPDLTVKQGEKKIRLADGKATASFDLANAKGGQGNYAVYVVAEAEVGGRHELASASIVVPISPQKTFFDHFSRSTWQRLGYGALLLTTGLWFIHLLRRRHQALPPGQSNKWVDTLILAASLGFIILNLSPHYLFTSTITTGGDTASHYYTLDYLRHVLLPLGKITGWTMGNYAGFPLLQFYFPLPFLLMCLLNAVIPLQVAFKLVSLLGTMLLPIAAYLLLRGLRRPFPAPILGAIFTLPFLFHSANSMWGANILSTLAGEFAYSLSMSLSLILLGSLYYGVRQGRWVIGNAVLVFLVGFSHGYTLLFVEAVSVFFLITDQGFLRRLAYLIKVYALGFLLLAFWLVPLLVFTRLTTSYHLVWVINSWKEIFPPQVLPFAALAGAGSLILLGYCAFKRQHSEELTAVAFLWFGLLASVVFFIAAPKLGVVDIRYVPYGQLLVALLSALFLGGLLRLLAGNRPLWALPILAMLGIFLWVGGAPGPAPDWAKWNYEGFEAKPAWSTFKQINDKLKGGFNDPRVVYEHSEEHNTFGSSRAFESLPLFSGRATLEGLYMQASISSPFVFYIQSEVSAVNSGPFPQYTYANMNFQRALPHLRLFNVGNLVIRSDGAKQAIRKVEGYLLQETIGNYELWKVTANNGHYVEPLAFEPVLLATKNWKADSYRWFMNEEELDVHLVFGAEEPIGPGQRFQAKADDLAGLPHIPIDTTACQVTETVGNDEISIDTNCIGKPLLIKVSYHPNWQVVGADRIYLVSPSFMLIYPTQSTVRLHYGRGWPDRLGGILTLLGLAILALNLPVIGKSHQTAWGLATGRLYLPPAFTPTPGLPPSSGRKRKALLTITIIGALTVGWSCYHIYTSDLNRIFNSGVRYKDAKQFAQAIAAFTKVAEEQPFSNLAQDSRYYTAICYYLDGKNVEAIAAFKKLISDYPKSLRIPEAYYHIGLCQFRLGQQEEGVATMNRIIRDYPGSEWSRHASNRLQEKKLPVAEIDSSANATADQQLGHSITLFNQDQLAAAASEFTQFIQRFPAHPQVPQALACLALIAYKQGDCASTITLYQGLIDKYPGHNLVPEAYYHIGLCEDRLGRRQEAKEAWQKAASLYPNTPYGRQSADKLKAW